MPSTLRRRPTLRAAVLLLVLASLAPPATSLAQVPVLERGPELARLDLLIGRWEGRLVRLRPGAEALRLAPTLETSWSLGGAWLESRDRTELPDGTVIHNRTWITWNARQDRYVGAWQDNVMAGFVDFHGRWLDDRRLELDSGEFDLAGRPHRVVFTYERLSEDELAVEMRQAWDGAEPALVAHGRFTRDRR